MYQAKFWQGQSMRHNSREDRIRGNPEAKPMHNGPGPGDEEDMTGADSPKLGTSQPRTKGNKASDEFPLRHANTKPHRHKQMHQVLMAHALRMHTGGNKFGDDGTTQGTAIGGGAAGGGAGS